MSEIPGQGVSSILRSVAILSLFVDALAFLMIAVNGFGAQTIMVLGAAVGGFLLWGFADLLRIAGRICVSVEAQEAIALRAKSEKRPSQ